MVDFIDKHRRRFGVERICRELPISPSTYHEFKARQADPSRLPKRHRSDAELKKQILQVRADNYDVYGARKTWKALLDKSIKAARCAVERLMKELGIRGELRGRDPRTTFADLTRSSPGDLVQRNFTATGPNQLWVADFTFVRTRKGFVYAAFVFDVYSRMIVGWQVARTMHAQLVLDALEQALYARGDRDQLIHHSDNGSQYLSIEYGRRLREAGIEASTGTVGDAYDNAMAESLIGLYKTELIKKRGPWKDMVDVEFATLGWVEWFNNRRLMAPLGYRSPQQFEEQWYSSRKAQPALAGATQ